MKLYTEADLKKVISIYSEEYKTSTDEILKELNITPHFQWLPTDDEIYERSFQQWGDYSKTSHQNTYLEGAKWMRNLIQGGNK
jgi:hypothetical protein